MNEILNEVKMMFLTDSVIAVIVFLAMMVDLGAGLYKAHLRGDARRSEALKRTGYKFLIYEGGILIASCVDLLIHMGKLYHILGWNIAVGVPFVTILLGIFWCVVEFLSVREKADEKTRTEMSRVEAMAAKFITKDELVEVLTEVLKKGAEKQLTKEE